MVSYCKDFKSKARIDNHFLILNDGIKSFINNLVNKLPLDLDLLGPQFLSFGFDTINVMSSIQTL